MKWAYGVTTVPERRKDLLPRTLASLEKAGFPAPRLFVDGATSGVEWSGLFGLEITFRHPRMHAFGNWLLSLQELLIREPAADRYAMFQDDLEACRGLRSYLEKTSMEGPVYLNCFTTAASANGDGWHPSKRPGTGAVALVFNRETVTTLLQQSWLHGQPLDGIRRKAYIDDCVRRCLQPLFYVEMVHGPSLVQHTGALCSTVGSSMQLVADGWSENVLDGAGALVGQT